MTRYLLTFAGVMALCIGLACPAQCQDLAELEVDHALTFDFKTPHTDWAQPYAGQKTRVLFFCDGRGTVPREAVELMQRFDIEAEAVFWARIVDSSDEHWHGGDIGEQRMLNLLEQKWDCYVMLGLGIDRMSAEQQYKLLKPVTEGAGLVFVGSDDKRVLKQERKLAELPAFIARGPVGDAYAIGKGRGIRLPGVPDIPYAEGWEVEYDYWQQRLGRAVLWAAGHEPRMQLRVDATPAQMAWDAEKIVTMTADGQPVGNAPQLKVRVRMAGADPIEFEQQPLPNRPHSVRLGALPAGEYHCDAWVISSAGVEAWDTEPFTVTSDLRVSDVALHQDWGEIGDLIAGTVNLEGAPEPDDRVRVGLFDRRGRLLEQVTLNPAEDLSFAFTIREWMPMLVRVDAALYRNPAGAIPAQTIHSAYSYCRVTKRHQGRFNFLMWDVPKGTLAPYAEQSLAENAVTLQLRSGNPPLMLSAFDIAWVPYTTRVMNSRDDQGIMKPFCWNDEEAVHKHVTEKAQEYLPSRQHGVFVWSLGDEVMTTGSCLSEHCAAAYRKYLQQEYGSLDALNASWRTDFGEWADVGLSKEGDDAEANSLAEGNYARWFDRQAYKSYNFVQFCQKYEAAYAEIDPKGRTGFEGAGRFDRGDDLDLIIRENTFWAPYPGVADEVIRSIAPRDFPRANWMGYTKDADSLLSKYWRMVTRGSDAVWWWRWDCIGRFHGWLAPDLRPFPAVNEILQDTQIMRDGLGDLLLKSQMQDTGIAMLYSYPSTFACKLGQGAGYGSYEEANVAFHKLLRDLGYQFSYVTDRMLRMGEFDAGKYRMLILPRAEAIGDVEAQVIRDYVEQGGVVIADVRPGLYDGHCKPREKGALDELFGVSCAGGAQARVSKAAITSEPGCAFGKAVVDPVVEPTQSRARGDAEGAPIYIVNRYGKGAAVLLNITAASIPRLAVADTPEEVADTAMDLVGRSGLHRPPVAMTGADGSRLRNIELIRWSNGDTEIMALFREAGNRETATITLPEARFVYDLRSGKALGRTGSFRTEIIPCRATFIALCRSAVPQPKLTLTPAAPRRGEVATATLSVPGAEGLYAYRIRVKTGDRQLDWLDQNVVAGAGPVDIHLPIAFNDPAGTYQVSAVELFTGAATTQSIAVQ